jgi:hypothetical protein
VTDPTTTGTDWEARALAAEAALAEARAESARLWTEVQELRAREREDDYWYRLYQAQQASVSWRITTPLRTGKRYAGKAQRLLRERNGG